MPGVVEMPVSDNYPCRPRSFHQGMLPRFQPRVLAPTRILFSSHSSLRQLLQNSAHWRKRRPVSFSPLRLSPSTCLVSGSLYSHDSPSHHQHYRQFFCARQRPLGVPAVPECNVLRFVGAGCHIGQKPVYVLIITGFLFCDEAPGTVTDCFSLSRRKAPQDRVRSGSLRYPLRRRFPHTPESCR